MEHVRESPGKANIEVCVISGRERVQHWRVWRGAGEPKRVAKQKRKSDKNSFTTYNLVDLFPFKIYTVGYDGETLGEISEKLDVGLEEISVLNDLESAEPELRLEPLKVGFLNILDCLFLLNYFLQIFVKWGE